MARKYRRRNPGLSPVSADVKIDWKLVGMIGLVAFGVAWLARRQLSEAGKEVAEALDITSKTNIVSKGAEALYNPGGLRKDPMTGKVSSIGSELYMGDRPDMDPSSPYYRWRTDKNGNYINFDKNGNYIYADKYGAKPPEKQPSFWNFITGFGLDGLPQGAPRRRYTA